MSLCLHACAKASCVSTHNHFHISVHNIFNAGDISSIVLINTSAHTHTYRSVFIPSNYSYSPIKYLTSHL